MSLRKRSTLVQVADLNHEVRHIWNIWGNVGVMKTCARKHMEVNYGYQTLIAATITNNKKLKKMYPITHNVPFISFPDLVS